MLLADERRELCAIGLRMAETGLVGGTAGNISVRSGDLVAVTPGGLMLDRMTPGDCPVIDIEGHLVESGGSPGGGHDRGASREPRGLGDPVGVNWAPRGRPERQPSSETPMHLAIYAETDATAIVHTHSTYGAVVATTMTELPPIHYNALLLGGVVRVAEYATYGTPELAANVRTAMAGGKRAVLLANHGGVAIGHDLEDAYEGAQLLEWLCGVYVRAKMIGEPRVLTDDELGQVIERAANPPAFPRRPAT
ncbi:MAG: L-fuculose-phosphate aldolase [Streptosporangiaceae bacterium]|jgi:L-fuculose-phosphate aldolase|nr:class aldolase/adducin family protein [Streptosporangiaceae bacterium]MDX6429461.1 L-fuculose-phosphate aldolase [Streptosporangiaceae bacterium]